MTPGGHRNDQHKSFISKGGQSSEGDEDLSMSRVNRRYKSDHSELDQEISSD